MTAFFAFMNDERENVQKDNPGMAHTGIAKIVGEMWKALSAENKKIYVDNNKMAMVQWKVDKQEYSKTDVAKAFHRNVRTVNIIKVIESEFPVKQPELCISFDSRSCALISG